MISSVVPSESVLEVSYSALVSLVLDGIHSGLSWEGDSDGAQFQPLLGVFVVHRQSTVG